jgi:hypothetical protein
MDSAYVPIEQLILNQLLNVLVKALKMKDSQPRFRKRVRASLKNHRSKLLGHGRSNLGG